MIQNYGNGLRTQWEFTYTARQVAYGARKQKEYRDSRRALWEAKHNEVLEQIRAQGLLVNSGAMESMLETMTVASSYMKGGNSGSTPTISIDKKLQDKFTESFRKKEEHLALSEQYEVWIQTLEAQPDEVLKITYEDFKFFFLNVDAVGIRNAASPAAQVATTGYVMVAPEEKLQGPMALGKLHKVDIPMLKPSTDSSLSPFQPYVAPPMTNVIHPVTPSTPAAAPILAPSVNQGAIFVPPDFESEVQNLPNALDDWPSD